MQSYALTTIEEPSFHEGKHILFADDELLLVEMTKRMLERIGCRVTAFTDGSGGLKVFTENPDSFDLDVADQTMSDMTGIAFAKDSLAVRKHMPVILCTGDGEIASQESACGVGIRGFVIMSVTKKAMARYYAEQIHKVLSPVGSPARLEGTVEDIAERNHAEKTQKEAEEKYRNIFENAMEGIFQSQPDGFPLSANPALARIFGYASAEEPPDDRKRYRGPAARPA